jgi:hypothetical protein
LLRREDETVDEFAYRLSTNSLMTAAQAQQQYTNLQRTTKQQQRSSRMVRRYTIDEHPPWSADWLAWVDIGARSNICTHCGALRWKKEKDSICCLGGKLTNPLLRAPKDTPPELQALFLNNDPQSKAFRLHIRQLNTGFAMVSVHGRVVHFRTSGPYSYIVQGALTRRHGALRPAANTSPSFIQCYVYDPNDTLTFEQVVQLRRSVHPTTANLDEELLRTLQRIIQANHPLVHSLQTCFQYAERHQLPHYNIRIVDDIHLRAYDPPASNEVAMFYFGDRTAQSQRDMIIRYRPHLKFC